MFEIVFEAFVNYILGVVCVLASFMYLTSASQQGASSACHLLP